MNLIKDHILIDKLILFLCSSFLLIFYQIDIFIICVILVALSIYNLSMYIDDVRFEVFVLILLMILSYIVPEFLVFLPLSVYDISKRDCQYLIILVFIILVVEKVYNWEMILLILSLSILSYLISLRTSKEARNYKFYIKLRDDMTKQQLDLNKKNHDLLEKQDYEIYSATLDERNRIAREIHDHVGHQLSSSILQIGALETINKDETMELYLSVLKGTLNKAMDDIRTSVHDLHHESLSLEREVNKCVDNFTFCPISFDYDVNMVLSSNMKYSFLAIVKEALVNVVRHSNADQVKILIREQPSFIQLVIYDNGSINHDADENGLGLSNMEERVNKLNGIFHIRKEKGFEIFVSVPKEDKT